MRRRAITPAETSTKANSVPMLTSLASVSSDSSPASTITTPVVISVTRPGVP